MADRSPFDWFRLRAGAFAAVPDDTVDAYLRSAAVQVPASKWDACANEAQALLAAHMLAMDSRAAASGTDVAGPATSKRTGDEAISFAGPTAATSVGDGGLAQTSYGMEYLRMRAQLPCTQLLFVGVC